MTVVRLRWADHIVQMDENKLHKKRYFGQTLQFNKDVADQNQDGLTW